MKRPECQGCIYDGKLIRCVSLDLEWALYEALKTIPFYRPLAKEPDPCDMKEEKLDVRRTCQ